jgi:NTP pyrophosphatase (non-canonical NTP hydrolase)
MTDLKLAGTSMPVQKNLLQQLAEQCLTDSHKYFPENMHTLSHHALALCGEVGEFANVVKKIERGSLDPDSEQAKIMLEGEAADILIYLMNIFGLLNVDPLKAYMKKRDFNNRRFGNGPAA